ncbi:MAG: endonuclease [Bacilli bacterium]|nr:endonuclease [Bacilli bacterium]
MPTNINMVNSTDLQVSNYYAGVNGKKGDALLGFLYTKIKDNNEYSYDNTTHRYIYKIIDRNWELDAIDTISKANTANFNYSTDNGFIHKLYADYNDDINTADRFKNVGATRVSFDKEHIWAQSLGNFGRTGGAGSDFHALWPSDVKGNQQGHSNYSFGIPQTGITSYNNDYGTYVGRNGYIAGSPNKVFEPLDQYKGDVARAMFYMPARYYQYVDTLHPKLELVNSSPDAHTASTSVTGKAGILDTLLAWHELDPVDDYEIKRNNLIANNYQMNRNPFIDYPQWARIAYDPSYSGTGATNALETSSVGTNTNPIEMSNLLSIELVTTSVKKTYNENERFSSAGLIVSATYDNGMTQNITNYNVSIAEGTPLTIVGTQNVTISATHNGQTKTASYPITVNPIFVKQLTSISVTNFAPTAELNSTYNNASVKVTAYYNDSTSKDVTSTAVIAYPNTSQLGIQSLRVDYTENAINKTAYYNVEIINQVNPVVYSPDLFISEYVEGSSNNKYIEIYNGTGQPVDLSNYNLLLFTNGSKKASTTTRLSGTLPHDSVIVYKKSTAVLTLPAGVTAIDASAINFNGDDVVALQKISTGKYVDIFGRIGQDPGTGWLVNGVKTVDVTLVRKPTINKGVTSNPSSFNPSLEWTMLPMDTVTNLGSR